MKKLFASILLAGAALSSNAAIFINNNTTCEAVLVLKAHNATNTAVCAFYSSRFPVAAGTSVAYNNVSNLNSPGGPGWFSPTTGSVTLTAPGSTWDAVTVYYGDMFGAINFDIGSAGTCAPSSSFSGSFPGCSLTSATWTNIGGGNILLDLN